jgi:NADPH:quinone reductase-like Zn-dependent oxidoreductase
MPKAVVLTGYVPPDVLVWRNIPLPEPGPGQVRIRVKAARGQPPSSVSADQRANSCLARPEHRRPDGRQLHHPRLVMFTSA